MRLTVMMTSDLIEEFINVRTYTIHESGALTIDFIHNPTDDVERFTIAAGQWKNITQHSS